MDTGRRSLHRHKGLSTTLSPSRNVFACSQPPPQQPQISCTILTQVDWCAVWTVARCELGLLQLSTLWDKRVRGDICGARGGNVFSSNLLCRVELLNVAGNRTRVCHSADPGGCHRFKVLQHRAGRFGRALFGALVPGSHLERPEGQGGCACALMRHAFASLGCRQPFVSRQQVVPVLALTSGSDGRETERSRTQDALCRLDADCRLCSYGPSANRRSTLLGH